MKLSPRHSKLVGLALANTSKQINRKPHSTACARALSRISVVLHDNSFRVHLGPLLVAVVHVVVGSTDSKLLVRHAELRKLEVSAAKILVTNIYVRLLLKASCP